MTSRERWTVYPLLVLAIGLGVRDKVWPARLMRVRTLAVDSLRAKEVGIATRIVCREVEAHQIHTAKLDALGIRLVASDGAIRASLVGELAQGGQLLLYNPEGQPVLSAGAEAETHSGILQISSPEGKPVVQLRSAAGHGVVHAINRDASAICTLTSEAETAGLFLELPRVQKVLPLRTVVIPSEASSTKAKP